MVEIAGEMSFALLPGTCSADVRLGRLEVGRQTGGAGSGNAAQDGGGHFGRSGAGQYTIRRGQRSDAG